MIGLWALLCVTCAGCNHSPKATVTSDDVLAQRIQPHAEEMNTRQLLNSLRTFQVSVIPLPGPENLLRLELDFAHCQDANLADALRRASHLPNVTRIELRGHKLSQNVFAGLREFPTLQYLDLSQCGMGQIGLEELSGLTQLEFLVLWGTDLLESDIAAIAKFPKLRKLDLALTHVTVEQLRGLRDCQSLEELFVELPREDDAQLANLQQIFPRALVTH